MKKLGFAQCLPLLVLPLLAACGGGSTGGSTAAPATATTPGTLVYNAPIRQISLSASQLQGNLTASASGTQLFALAAGGKGALPCGVDVYKLQFDTVGGANETTQSSGALMVPTGTGCAKPTAIVLYGHGTTTSKNYDISALQDPSNPANSESALIAAIFAANGFIVVAPNYAGYDNSALGYHPYLNAKQSSIEMQNALAAARTALPTIGGASDAGALLVTGYSQGGHVAMATVRDLEAAGQTVTASAPMSGPYAMEAFGDEIFLGNVDVGATVFIPLITTSYQKAYGNLYTATTDIYTSTYAANIDKLLPSTLPIDTIFANSLLPQTALFDSVPTGAYASLPQNPNPLLGDFGFGTSFLINDSTRAAYLQDVATNTDPVLAGTGILPSTTAASPIRVALRTNDLRMKDGNGTAASFGFWLPKSPMLLCAGGGDTTVFSGNTQIINGYFGYAGQALGRSAGLVSVLNVDATTLGTGTGKLATTINPLSTNAVKNATLTGTFALLQAGFAQSLAAVTASGGATAAFANYHETVAPICTAAAATWFQYVLTL